MTELERRALLPDGLRDMLPPTAGFEADVISASATQPVIVDFWAEWCGPCKTLGPTLEKIVNEYGGAVRLVKINVDENPVAASKFGVRGLPTLMMFKDGKVTATHLGAMSKQRIAEWIKESA